MGILKGKSLLIQAFDPRNLVLYFLYMKKEFGLKFTLMLISNYFGVKGTLNDFVNQVQTPFYLHGGWEPSQYNMNKQTAYIPWVIKGMGGILTDILPIGGYEKGTYLFIYALIGSLSVLLLALFEMKASYTAMFIPAALFFFINVETSFNDLLLEGKYVDLMKRNPNNKGNVITFNVIMVTLGTILPTFTVGTLAEVIDVRFIFFIYIPFAFQPIIFLFFGCLVEDRASPERNNKIDVLKIREQSRVLFIALLISINGLIATLIGMFSINLVAAIYNVCGATVLSIALFYTLPKAIAKILLYVFIVRLLYFDVEAYLSYFYIDSCVEGGPAFGTAYYQTYIGSVGIVAKLIGVWIFQAILVNFKFRYMFWFPTVLTIIGASVDIIMINRWNLVIGIPDKVMYMIGGGVLIKMIDTFNGMPMSLMCAKVCPKRIETAMFSVIAGFANYGQTVGGYVANVVASLLEVQLSPATGNCSTHNLAWLVFIGHMVAPFITIFLTFFMIPNTYANENIADAYFQTSKYYTKNPDDPVVTLEAERAKNPGF